MKRKVAALTIGALFCLAQGSFAQELIPGTVAKQNVQNLTQQVNWCTSLSQAENQATREGKMVFWMHMLGTISGPT